jgi:hypothetical protein
VTAAFDDRLVSVSFVLANNQIITYNEDFWISAFGTKYQNWNAGDCEVRLDNIDLVTRNNIITQTSPLNPQRAPVQMQLLAGRKSLGAFVMFQGGVIATNPTQPPDIGLVARSLTLSLQLANIVNTTMPSTTNLSTISQQVANQLGVRLDFRATDKQVDNYSFTGAALKQVGKIADAGNYVAFVDGDTLVVLDNGQPRNAAPIQINSSTGMLGVPEITESGVRVRVLINGQIRVGDQIQVTSDINPAANGLYNIFLLHFEVASRETPFYWNIEAKAKRFYLAGNNS